MTTKQANNLSTMLKNDDEILSNSSLDLNSSDEVRRNENKSTNKRPKLVLSCVVCVDDAYGYNFDAISCESCKAFFRRNALRPPGKLKCRESGRCEVIVESRKRCKKCRLDKCFRMGMRKEWILSEEEKKKKKRKIEQNRRRTQQPQDTTQQRTQRSQTNSKTDNSGSNDELPSQFITDHIPSMTQSDWSKIEQVQTAYSEAIALNEVTGVSPYPAIHPIHSSIDLIRIPAYLASIRLITYVKKCPEFSLFDPDDRVTLLKHNLLAVVFIHTVLIYDPAADTYHEHNTQDPIFQGKDWIGLLGELFYHDLTRTATKLIQTLEYDRVIVKLLLLITLYTKGFCSYDLLHEPSLNNMSIVMTTQNIYVDLLYRYCLHQYGFNKTIKLFTNLIGQLFVIQRLAVQLKDFVHSNIDASQLSPLMKNVLQVSESPKTR